jgi:hypothetical protein
VAVLKLCKWRPMGALLLYLWCKCMVPWFFWTFFHFSSLLLRCLEILVRFKVGTQDHCKVGLFYFDMLALNIVLLTAFLCWNIHNRTCAFVVHFDIFEFHNGLPYVQSYWCFLIIVGGHLVTGCMALQTIRLISIMVCTSWLTFRRCAPSIKTKYHHVIIFLIMGMGDVFFRIPVLVV